MTHILPHNTALLLHFLFAGITIALNIGSQAVIIIAFGSSEKIIFVSILAGTAIGLISKYMLDKFIIYRQNKKNHPNEIKAFAVYTLTGVFTTLVFWIIEYGFHIWIQTDTGRYFGALLGLTIGYTIKFYVDRRYVF